jgi:predicted O-methyltransferase YrrM
MRQFAGARVWWRDRQNGRMTLLLFDSVDAAEKEASRRRRDGYEHVYVDSIDATEAGLSTRHSSGMDYGLVNHVALLRRLALRYHARSYLEIGVKDGYTLFRVPTRRKVGVDPDASLSVRHRTRYARANRWNLLSRAYVTTSDEFFAKDAKRLFGKSGVDLVFIDGKHTYEQTLRDIRSALELLSPHGLIVVHDTNPADIAEAWPADSPEAAAADNPPGWQGRWCGDVWKAVLAVRQTTPELGLTTLPEDFGMTIINPRIAGPAVASVPREIDSLGFEDFVANRHDWLALRDPSTLEAWLARDPKLPGTASAQPTRPLPLARAFAYSAALLAAVLLLFVGLPELLNDWPYNPIGKDSRVTHEQDRSSSQTGV